MLSVAHLAHMLATVIWIGGILLFPFVIMPAAGLALGQGPEVGKFMGAFAKKFKPLAYTCMALFFITGIYMMYVPGTYIEPGVPGGPYQWLLRIKILVVLVMIIIGIYMGEVNARRIDKLMAGGSGSEGPPAELAKYQSLQIKLLKMNAFLSFVVLVLTAINLAIAGTG